MTQKKKASPKKKELKPQEVNHEVLPPAKVTDDEEPSWYHYIIVLLGLALLIGLLFVGFETYEHFNPPERDITNPLGQFKYPYVVGNVTYNLYFHYPTEELEAFDFEIELDKLDILNTINFTFVFREYNGTDNGLVSTTSTKFRRFLDAVYKFKFNENSFQRFGNYSCSNSTLSNKVLIFDPYTNESGVFYDELTGCMIMRSQGADEIVAVGDKLIWELIKEE